jgi:hypothetical protein
MSQAQVPTNNNLKQKAQNYSILLGYSILGILGLGFFSYRMIMIRYSNKEKYKIKSRIPVLDKNIKYLGMGGLVAAVIYTYGLW